MDLTCIAMTDAGGVMIATLVIAVWLVLMSLKAIAQDVDEAIRWHNLKIEAHTLRLAQLRRLQELGVKKKR